MKQDLSYLTDHYDEKINRLQEINGDFNFIFMTDQHNGLSKHDLQWHPEKDQTVYEDQADAIHSMAYLLERFPRISCAVCGGDIGNDYSYDKSVILETHRGVMDAFYSLGIPILNCIGNHDDASGHSYLHAPDMRKLILLPDELHQIMMRDNPTDENYFYYDFPQARIRIICLNTSDIPYLLEGDKYKYHGYERIEISDQQLWWLENDALDTSYGIFVCSHVPLRNKGIIGSEGEPELIKPVEDLINGDKAFRLVQSHPNVLACIAGHVHYDNLLVNDGVLMITSQCGYACQWTPSAPERTIGTYTETAFDVVSLKGDKLYLTRFGAGEDRETTLNPL